MAVARYAAPAPRAAAAAHARWWRSAAAPSAPCRFSALEDDSATSMALCMSPTRMWTGYAEYTSLALAAPVVAGAQHAELCAASMTSQKHVACAD